MSIKPFILDYSPLIIKKDNNFLNLKSREIEIADLNSLNNYKEEKEFISNIYKNDIFNYNKYVERYNLTIYYYLNSNLYPIINDYNNKVYELSLQNYPIIYKKNEEIKKYKYDNLLPYNKYVEEYNKYIEKIKLELKKYKTESESKTENNLIEIENNLIIDNKNIEIIEQNNINDIYNYSIIYNKNVEEYNKYIQEYNTEFELKLKNKLNSLDENDLIEKDNEIIIYNYIDEYNIKIDEYNNKKLNLKIKIEKNNLTINKYITNLKKYNDDLENFNNQIIMSNINLVNNHLVRSQNPTSKLIFLNYLYDLYIYLQYLKIDKKIKIEFYFEKIDYLLNNINNLYELLYNFNYGTEIPKKLLDTDYYILTDNINEKNILFLSKNGSFTRNIETILEKEDNLKVLEINLNDLIFKNYIIIRDYNNDIDKINKNVEFLIIM
jgi:hypothetical protein